MIYSENFYRSVFEHSMEAVFLTAPDGSIFVANPAACKLFLLSEEEICKLGRLGLIDASSPQLAGFLDELTRTGRARAELVFIRGDGTRFPGEVSSEKFFDDNGQERTVLIVRDLTGIKQSELKLIESEEQYRLLITAMAEGVTLQDENSAILAFNKSAERILGLSADQLAGRTSFDPRWYAIHEDGSPFPGETHPVVQTLKTGLPQSDVVMGIHKPDGRLTWISVNVQPIFKNGQTTPYRVVATMHDITERKHAEQKLAEYVKRLENTMQNTLQAVANMVEIRDPYTAGHERRVGLVARDIAREMGWPEEKCHDLELIGLVHDIGKIAIPAEILTKPGRLTQVEYQIVQMHSARGYEILKDVDFPLPIAEIIYQHHERLDGSGYPRSLKEDEILPEARILAVADVLESMASHRPYRPALGIDAALKEIEDHRGTWFDAAAVDAMLRLIREKGYQLPA
jgi:PAS domain S-box-containing protein